MPANRKAKPQVAKRRRLTSAQRLAGAALVVALLMLALVFERNVAGRATQGVLSSADQVQRIAPRDAKAMLDKGEAVLYDVRSEEAYQEKHAAGAVSLPEEKIDSLLDSLPRDKALILYCT